MSGQTAYLQHSSTAVLLTMPGQINGSTNGAANGTNGTAHTKDTLPKELVDEMQRLFGKHKGYRTSMLLQSWRRTSLTP